MGVKAIRAKLEVQLLGDFNCVSATATSLGLPETLPVEEWKKIGVQLGSAGRTLQWWIADWWAFGTHHYGERRQHVEDWGGLSFRTCENYASVARRFESSRRRELLSFSHHQAVAYDDPAFADALLDWCLQDHEKRGRRTVDELKAERDERIRKRDQENVTRIFRRTIPDRNTTFRIVTEDLPGGGRRTTTTLFPSPPRPMVRLDDSGTFEPVPEQLAALQIEPTAAPPEVAESFDDPLALFTGWLSKRTKDELAGFPLDSVLRLVSAISTLIAARPEAEQHIIKQELIDDINCRLRISAR